MILEKQPPKGVAIIAALFFLAAAYLEVCGAIMLAAPGAISMARGAPLLGGLELAGPYMFLLVGTIGALIAWGLLRLNRWARRAAIIVALLGLVELIPSVSSAVFEYRGGQLAWGGIAVMVRAMIVWYLYQPPVTEQFN